MPRSSATFSASLRGERFRAAAGMGVAGDVTDSDMIGSLPGAARSGNGGQARSRRPDFQTTLLKQHEASALVQSEARPRSKGRQAFVSHLRGSNIQLVEVPQPIDV